MMIGKKAEGTVFKLSAFTAGEHNSRVNFIAKNKKEYRFEVNSNVKGTATVIYDPNNPDNAYLFNFMNFVLEKIIFSLLAAIPSTIFVFFFLKKNQYLFIDLKRFKFSKGLKRWTEEDNLLLNEFITEAKPEKISLSDYIFLTSKGHFNLNEYIESILHELYLNNSIEIVNKLVQINKTDNKQKPRPFVRLNKNVSTNTLTSIEKEILSVFEVEDDLRLHEIRQKLQQKFGKEFEKFNTDFVFQYFHNSAYLLNSDLSESGKNITAFYGKRLQLIERQFDNLIADKFSEFCLLLNSFSTIAMVMDKKTLSKTLTLLNSKNNKENSIEIQELKENLKKYLYLKSITFVNIDSTSNSSNNNSTSPGVFNVAIR